jgi:hypothetical protein
MSVKTQSIGALFVALVIILAVNPKVVNNMYSSILGRLFLVCVVVFFAMNNTTLGLLAALAVITASNQFGSFVEGMDNMDTTTPITVGEENVDTTGGQTVLTKGAVADTVKKRVSDLKQSVADGTIGVDKEDIKAAIMSRDSKQLPVDPNMNSSNENILPSSSGMLNSSNSTLEGFTAYASF